MPDILTMAHDTRIDDLFGQPLSREETKLLILFVSTGKRDKELAFAMQKSIQTIKNQLQAIRHKTGCKNRSSLILWYNSRSGGVK